MPAVRDRDESERLRELHVKIKARLGPVLMPIQEFTMPLLEVPNIFFFTARYQNPVKKVEVVVGY